MVYIVELNSRINIQYGIYHLVLSIQSSIESHRTYGFSYILENFKTFKIIWGELKYPIKY